MTVMDWTHADPQVEINGCIARLEDDQHRHQLLAEQALQVEIAATETLERARRVQADCRATIDADATEIKRLRAELIPGQRQS